MRTGTKFGRWGVGLGAVGAALIAAMSAMTTTASAADPAATQPAAAQRAAQAANGAAIFRRTCNRCHPNGNQDIGPTLHNINWDAARMTRQIRQGSGRMRPIAPARLPDAQIPALLAYMRTQFHSVR
jgi:mono/diheme cytochrome c family protein